MKFIKVAIFSALTFSLMFVGCTGRIKPNYSLKKICNYSYSPEAKIYRIGFNEISYLLIADKAELNCFSMENESFIETVKLPGNIIECKFNNIQLSIICSGRDGSIYQYYTFSDTKPYILLNESFEVKGSEIVADIFDDQKIVINNREHILLITKEIKENKIYLYEQSELKDLLTFKIANLVERLHLWENSLAFMVYDGNKTSYFEIRNHHFQYPVKLFSTEENGLSYALDEFTIKSKDFDKSFIASWSDDCYVFNGESFFIVGFDDTSRGADNVVRYVIKEIKAPEINTFLFESTIYVYFSGIDGTYVLRFGKDIENLSSSECKLLDIGTINYYDGPSFQTCWLGFEAVGNKQQPICIFDINYDSQWFDVSHPKSYFDGLNTEIYAVKLAKFSKARTETTQVYFITEDGLYKSEPLAVVNDVP